MNNKKNIDRIVQASILSLLVCTGSAQAQSNVSIADIQNAANRSGDKSMSALEMIFGSVVHNPLAGGSGGGGGMIADVFLVLNSCILAVGIVWAIYIFGSGVMATGQDGELLGQKKASSWFVVRMFTGFCSLVPMFGGYCGAQIIMLWAAMMGVGIANLSQDAAIAVLRSGGSMVVTPASPQTLGLAKYLLEANLCAESANAAVATMPRDAGVSADPGETFRALFATNKVVLMNGNGLSCGGAEVSVAPNGNWNNVSAAHAAALTSMQAELNQAAQQFVNAIMNGIGAPDLQTAIDNSARAYEGRITSIVASSRGQIDALASRIEGDLKRDGWLMMGTWYQTFAQENTQLTKAVNATASGVPGTDPDQIPYPSTLRKVMSSYEMQMARNASVSQANTPAKTIASTGSDDKNFVQRVFNSGSLGQTLTAALISGNSNNSAGGTTNPLIGMKNLGDAILNTGTAAIAAWTGIRVVEKVAKKNIVGNVADKISGWSGISEGLIESLGVFVYMGIIALFFFGAMLSIYIPMVPFIIWFGGVISWLAVVGEGV